jgi:type IV secretory pathway TrbD component
MTSLHDYALPVHKSMHQNDLLLGVPKNVAIVIVCATILLAYLLGMFFALLGIVLYLPCFFISKRDPLLLSMALDSIFQADILEG